jgi:hypothetical protein
MPCDPAFDAKAASDARDSGDAVKKNKLHGGGY